MTLHSIKYVPSGYMAEVDAMGDGWFSWGGSGGGQGGVREVATTFFNITRRDMDRAIRGGVL